MKLSAEICDIYRRKFTYMYLRSLQNTGINAYYEMNATLYGLNIEILFITKQIDRQFVRAASISLEHKLTVTKNLFNRVGISDNISSTIEDRDSYVLLTLLEQLLDIPFNSTRLQPVPPYSTGKTSAGSSLAQLFSALRVNT